jgi:hypothetical protein
MPWLLGVIERLDSDFIQLARYAYSRAAILGMSFQLVPGAWRPLARLGQERCLCFARRLELRGILYSDVSLVRRTRIFGSLLYSKAYTTDGGFGLGVKSATKDFVVLLLPRGLLKKTRLQRRKRQITDSSSRKDYRLPDIAGQ